LRENGRRHFGRPLRADHQGQAEFAPFLGKPLIGQSVLARIVVTGQLTQIVVGLFQGQHGRMSLAGSARENLGCKHLKEGAEHERHKVLGQSTEIHDVDRPVIFLELRRAEDLVDEPCRFRPHGKRREHINASVRDLAKAGVSLKEIGRRMELSRGTVRRMRAGATVRNCIAGFAPPDLRAASAW